MEKLSLIDVLSEDDLLISSSSDLHPDMRSSESTDAHEGGNLLKMSQQWEHVPEMSESPEQKRAKSGKVNLRKSLAWDSAFFTGEGVLNTEELAIVNSTFRKTEVCSLPGIQEELRKSTESTSTLDSESYTLENLEGDLFENLRASIQMSFNKRDNCSIDEPAVSCPGSRKKAELPSQTKMKPPISSKRDNVNRQQLDCTSKDAVLGVKEAAKGRGDSKLLLNPPRIVPKPTSLPALRSNKDASGSIQIKNYTRRISSGNGANRHGVVAFSKTNGDSSTMISNSISSSKPNPGSHLGTVVFSKASCLSNSSPVSSPSHLAGKSPLEPTRKRSAMRNSDQSLSGSTTKPPVRASKSKLRPSNLSHPPTCANSTLKFSLRASPSSSIDSVFSEASSSTSTSIKPSNSVESIASSTSSSHSAVPTGADTSQPADMQIGTIDQPHIRKEISTNLLQSQPIAKASVSARLLSEPSNRDHARISINSNAGVKSFKPSGLRMPSPKIGYFDAEKTLGNNSNKLPQIGLRNSSLKGNSGTSDTVGANKPKSSKIPSIRHAAQHVGINFHQARSASLSPQSRSLASPLSIHQHSKPTQLHKDLSPVTSEGNQNMVYKGAAKVAAGVHMQPMATVLAGRGSTFSGEVNSDVTDKGTQAAHQFDKEEKHEQLTCGYNQDEHITNQSHSVSIKIQKENLLPAYEANCLTHHSLSECQKISVVEIMDKKMSSLSLSETTDLVGGGD